MEPYLSCASLKQHHASANAGSSGPGQDCWCRGVSSTMKKVASEVMHPESRNPSTHGVPSIHNRVLSQKSLRKGLARGSMAMVAAPAGHAGEVPAATQPQPSRANSPEPSTEVRCFLHIESGAEGLMLLAVCHDSGVIPMGLQWSTLSNR